MRWLRELITLAAAMGADILCKYAGFRQPYCLAAAVITVMLFKADQTVHHRRENPWFKHKAPWDPSPKRITETSSVRQARRARVWGSTFGE